MTKIACLSQRPIQTLILIYLLGEKNFKFDLVIYSPIKKIIILDLIKKMITHMRL